MAKMFMIPVFFTKQLAIFAVILVLMLASLHVWWACIFTLGWALGGDGSVFVQVRDWIMDRWLRRA